MLKKKERDIAFDCAFTVGFMQCCSYSEQCCIGTSLFLLNNACYFNNSMPFVVKAAYRLHYLINYLQ